MEVKPYTGLIQLQYRTMVRRFAEFYTQWADEMGLDPDYLSELMETYIITSLRVELNGDRRSTHFLKMSDTEDQLKKKFTKFLDIEVSTTNAWVASINELDVPPEPDLANDAEIPDGEDAEKNAGSDVTGNATS